MNKNAVLLLKVGLANALLVTVLSSLVIALLSGTGIDEPITQGAIAQPARIWFPNLWEVFKATLLLCPLTAVWYGWQGLGVGIVGGVSLFLRTRYIKSARRLYVESAVAGMILAIPFLLTDYGVVIPRLLAFMVCGPMCGLICAFMFRRAFLERYKVDFPVPGFERNRAGEESTIPL